MERIVFYLIYFAILCTFCKGEEKTIVLKGVEQCPIDNPPDLDVELSNNDDGELALTMRASYDYDIDDNYKILVDIEKLKNGNWEKSTSYEDKWCAVLMQFSRPWNVAKTSIQPPLPDGCLVPGGQYTMENFQMNREDVAQYIEFVDPGTYKANFAMYIEENGKKEDDVLCLLIKYNIEEL